MKQYLKGHLRVKELDTPVQNEPKHYVQHVSKKKPIQLCDITPESSQGELGKRLGELDNTCEKIT